MKSYGPPECLVVGQAPEPSVGPQDVLVQIHAAAVNPVDTKLRQGVQRAAVRYKLPWILGLDVSGVVLQVGTQVTRFAPGDEVFSSPTHRRPGCYAERVAIHQDELAHKPKNLSHEEAASLPLVALTAWQCLMPRLQTPGQRVFVQGGSGGVGAVAIQIAKAKGAWVAASCSQRNAELVTTLGADQVIDYRSQDYTDLLSDLDLVLESQGPAEWDRSLSVLKRGGRLASIASGMPAAVHRYGPYLGLLVAGVRVLGLRVRGALRGIEAVSVLKRCDGAQLAQIASLVESGALRPVVDRVFAMDQTAEAHAYQESGKARGKIVLRGWA